MLTGPVLPIKSRLEGASAASLGAPTPSETFARPLTTIATSYLHHMLLVKELLHNNIYYPRDADARFPADG